MNLSAIIRRTAVMERTTAEQNAAWLDRYMSPYFFQAMADEEEAILWLSRGMGRLRRNRSLILIDREKLLVLARVNQPGSLYDSLRRISDRKISYAMFSLSNAPMPDMNEELEVQRFEFDLRRNREIDPLKPVSIPGNMTRKVRQELRRSFPDFDLKKLEPLPEDPLAQQ